jgi:hypothetical protein
MPNTLKIAQYTPNKMKKLKKILHYCTMCNGKIKGPPKIIPTSLQNVIPSRDSESTNNIHNETIEFHDEDKSHHFLHSQVIWRDPYIKRGEDCIFCCWDCAREWNKKYSPVNHRYMTQKLIDIAAGKFT